MRDKILVVDDEKDIVSMLRDYFEIAVKKKKSKLTI